jgi:hypothetical protein
MIILDAVKDNLFIYFYLYYFCKSFLIKINFEFIFLFLWLLIKANFCNGLILESVL